MGPLPVSPTDWGFPRAGPNTGASDAPRGGAASGLRAYLLFCNYERLTCALSRHSAVTHLPQALESSILPQSLAKATQSRPSPPLQPALSIRAPAASDCRLAT